MLLQAVIDAIVDLSLPIGKAVGEAFDELEQAVLTEPTIGQSKQLHVLRSGLTLLMENANEIGIVVRTLCDHGAVPGSGRGKSTGSAGEKVDLTAQIQTSVHISPTTQIYLRDVQDHVTALSNNTRTSIRSAENLSSLIFNTIAASQNESVRQLTILSAFFLPLTFLTGYFGMNFDPMPAVNNHSDALFWWIAGPIMLASGALVLRTRAKANRPEAWMRQPRPMQMNTRRHRRRPCGEKSESL
jgi:Mg2+ and Co2+ transporter CorA